LSSLLPELDALLAEEGWPHASAPPQDEGDPGRYHALYGRDSLITALQVLPARPDVARATLRALAALQGRADDPELEEEPGKIPHELYPHAPQRLVDLGFPVRDGALRYYGTADATSWFCLLLGALGDRALTVELEGAWRAGGDWIERTLERGGGLLRHERRGAGGLRQMGWRDAVDPLAGDGHGGGILREDGTAPQPPLADADTQAATFAALRALSALSGEVRFAERAAKLAGRLAAEYVPDVLALEAGDRPVRGAGSQLGWLLWCGALEDHPEAREAAAERLCRPDVLTPFGLRTLSSEHGAFDVHGYHRGSVWPFDSWLGWGGLRAAGRAAEAERLRRGVLDALGRLGRAPELYAVTLGGELEPIGVANRVQAWTVGARWALAEGWDGGAC
jgi:glycogen debranching enzyme